MADRNWIGAAPRVAQVRGFVFAGTWEATDLIRATFPNGKRRDFTAGSTVTATVAANLATDWAALASADFPEFAELTPSSNGTTFTLTAATAGKPFSVTLTPLETGGGAADAQTIDGGTTASSGADSTANSSPEQWDIAANWREGAVPVTGDDATIAGGPSIRYGLDQSAVTLASLTITREWQASNEIGLPENTNLTTPASGYPEYRSRRLAIGATVVDVETGSGRVRLDLTAASTTVTVRDTGRPADGELVAVDLKLAATANVSVLKGDVGCNLHAGDSGTLADLNVAYVDNVDGDARVYLGPDAVLTNLDQTGGYVRLLNGVTTVSKAGGTLDHRGATTTLRNRGGRLNLNGTGTITLLETGGPTYRRGLAAMTVTTLRLFSGAQGGFGEAPVTIANPMELYECRFAEGPDDRGDDVVYWNSGFHKKYTVAAI